MAALWLAADGEVPRVQKETEPSCLQEGTYRQSIDIPIRPIDAYNRFSDRV